MIEMEIDMKKVTLKDVARESGVSFSLVSKTLNGTVNTQISKEKAELVKQTAQRLGYVTNRQARQLRTGKSQTIAVITPIYDQYSTTIYPALIQGILSSAQETKYDFIFFHSSNNDIEDRFLAEIIALNPDGILYAVPAANYKYVPADTINRRIDMLTDIAKSGKRILFCMEKYSIPGTVTYLFDDEAGGYLGTKYFIKKGYKRIFFCRSAIESRFQGYKRAMDEQNLDCDGLNKLVGFSHADGYSFVKDVLMKMDKIPEAIFATCDMNAWGILKAFEELNINKIEVFGFDGLAILQYSNYNFPTIVQPVFTIGQEAARAIVSWIENEETIEGKLYAPEIKFIKDLNN